MRRRHLRLLPLCEVCLESETVEPASVVHHRQRHDGIEDVFFDEGQLQSLCWDCRNALRTAPGGAPQILTVARSSWERFRGLLRIFPIQMLTLRICGCRR